MTPGMLFWERWKNEWLWQWKVWRTAIDWTVALYLIIPGCIIAVVEFRSWWEKDAWLAHVPLGVVSLFFFGVVSVSRLRLHVKAVDLLILQQKRWLHTVMARALALSAAGQAGLIAVWVMVFLPWMRVHHSWEWLAIIIWSVTMWLTSLSIALIKQLLPLWLPGWKRFIAVAVHLLTGIPFFGVVAIGADQGRYGLLTLVLLICMAMVAGLLRVRFRAQGLIETDIRQEQRQRMRWAGLLLQVGQVAPPRKWGTWKRPLLFRRSQPLGQRTAARDWLWQAAFKSTLRSWSRISFPYQLAVIASAAIWWSSGLGSWLLVLGVPWLLALVSGSLWREFMESSYIRMFTWAPEERAWACFRYVLLLTGTGCVLLSISFGLSVWSLWHLLLSMGLSGGSGWVAAWVIHRKELLVTSVSP